MAPGHNKLWRLQPKQDLEAKNRRKKNDFEKFIDIQAAGKDLLQILNRKDQNYAFITLIISCGREKLSQDDKFRKKEEYIMDFIIFGTSEISFFQDFSWTAQQILIMYALYK